MKRQNYGEFIIEVEKNGNTTTILNKQALINILNNSKYGDYTGYINKKLIVRVFDADKEDVYMIHDYVIKELWRWRFVCVDVNYLAGDMVKGVEVEISLSTDGNHNIINATASLNYRERTFVTQQ